MATISFAFDGSNDNISKLTRILNNNNLRDATIIEDIGEGQIASQININALGPQDQVRLVHQLRSSGFNPQRGEF